MELLRRALLVGCVLSGLWLLRLATLDPLVSIRRVDFGGRQRLEAASVPEDRKTDAQQRRAVIPLSVYIEETLQFNVFSAAGAGWDRFLAAIDEARTPTGEQTPVFVQLAALPDGAVEGKIAAGAGTTYISMSRPGGDAHYEVIAHRWTRDDFRLGRGFFGSPVPPASLFYPFRTLGLVLAAGGVLLFLLLPPASPPARMSAIETTGLAVGLLMFAAPLAAVGGSVQALTRSTWLTFGCWVVAAAGLHLFAAPWRSAQLAVRALFLREGLVFLLMAVGPAAFLVWGTMLLWNR